MKFDIQNNCVRTKKETFLITQGNIILRVKKKFSQEAVGNALTGKYSFKIIFVQVRTSILFILSELLQSKYSKNQCHAGFQ